MRILHVMTVRGPVLPSCLCGGVFLELRIVAVPEGNLFCDDRSGWRSAGAGQPTNLLKPVI
jgi:hypothetical protein